MVRWPLPRGRSARDHQVDRFTNSEVPVMSWLILVVLAVLALLIVAGPVLEDMIDRIWPPGGRRPSRTRSR